MGEQLLVQTRFVPVLFVKLMVRGGDVAVILGGCVAGSDGGASVFLRRLPISLPISEHVARKARVLGLAVLIDSQDICCWFRCMF